MLDELPDTTNAKGGQGAESHPPWLDFKVGSASAELNSSDYLSTPTPISASTGSQVESRAIEQILGVLPLRTELALLSNVPENILDVGSPKRQKNSDDLDLSPETTVPNKQTLLEGLSEELVETIISKMPFPLVFQTCILSAHWYFKLPHISTCLESLPAGQIRHPSQSSKCFQHVINSVSYKWPVYCPIFISKGFRGEMTGFDGASSQWRTLPSISYLPFNPIIGMHVSSIAASGPLLCVTRKVTCPVLRTDRLDVYVTNPLARDWRKLPKTPFYYGQPHHLKIILTDSGGYKVLLLLKQCAEYGLNVVWSYDSNLRTWSKKTLLGALGYEPVGYDLHKSSAYLNGTLYCFQPVLGAGGMPRLWAYHTDGDTWVVGPELFNDFPVLRDVAVLVCGDKVMVVITSETDGAYRTEELMAMYPGLDTAEDMIYIYELDIHSLQLKTDQVYISRAPPQIEVKLGIGLRPCTMKFTSDGDFIYCGQIIPHAPFISYNVASKEWHCCPPPRSKSGPLDRTTWIDISFKPGMCPFVKA